MTATVDRGSLELEVGAAAAERPRRFRGGWRIVARKEFTDHVRSIRFLLLVILMSLAGLAAVHSAAGPIRDAADSASQTPSIFLYLFTLSPERVPAFHEFIGILEDYVGHGIGSAMHQPPNVPNYGRPGRGPKLVRGLALAVEPMVVLGSPQTRVLEDDWTVVTEDGSWAAHAENTFTLTPDGAWVLTALDGGAERLGELGVPYGGPE